jgi:PTS system nitrogen regulatory IIA component
MSLSDLGSLGGFIGAIAVLVFLVYLALRILFETTAVHLENHIARDMIFLNLQPPDKQSLLEDLAQKAASQIREIDKAELLQKLREREGLQSSGLGDGVALPHQCIEGLKETVCFMAQIPGGVEFDSLDEAPVHFVFLLLSPPGSGHLKVLAGIARLCRQEGFVGDISGAENADRIYELVVQGEARLLN